MSATEARTTTMKTLEGTNRTQRVWMLLRSGGTSSRFISTLPSTPTPDGILQEQVAILVADVHDLALYTKLNFTGFIKIVKAGGAVEA